MIQFRPSRWIAFILLVSACSQFVSSTDSNFNEVVYNGDATKGVILFSHNINGETQPCGCRKFPLGGLEQAAGHFHQQHAKGPVIYVDTGDMLFPTPVIPDHLLESHLYTASVLVEAMGKFGLNYFVPGDQDFALGLGYLEKLSQTAPFTFLLANLKEGTQLKSLPWAKARVGQKNIILIGVLDPELLPAETTHYFSNPEEAIKKALSQASPNKDDLVVLLSHSGMERDKQYASAIPRLDWIIGGHSQGYTTRPVDQGDTEIVQVLSRNHFIGRIEFGLGEKDTQTSFSLLETREEMANAVKPNPMTSLMVKWKTGLQKVQEEEQKKFAGNLAPDPLPTFNSCLDCHKPQVAFWQKTSHSLAWQTLVAKGSHNDPSCIGCHSLGWQHPQGFSATPQRVRFGGQLDSTKLQAYTNTLATSMNGLKAPRTLTPKQRFQYSQKWMKAIEDHGVTHEYGNVQCVNCHDKNRDHPFAGPTRKESKEQMVSKCLNCHNSDQSPDWYLTDAKGIPGKPSEKVINAKYKSVSCPAK